MAKPAPRSPSIADAGTRTPVNDTSAWLSNLDGRGRGSSMDPRSRSTVRPGVPAGTTNCDARRCGSASGSVTAMTKKKSATEAFVMNHLCPCSTQSSPSSTAAVVSSVGSAPASGSVIAYADRIRPASNGSR